MVIPAPLRHLFLVASFPIQQHLHKVEEKDKSAKQNYVRESQLEHCKPKKKWNCFFKKIKWDLIRTANLSLQGVLRS